MYLTAGELLTHTPEEHSVPWWSCDYCPHGTRLEAESQKIIATPKQFFPTAEAWVSHVAEMHSDLIAPQHRGLFAKMNEQ